MIIGFVAPKQHGKTTACNIIKKHLDDVVQINFKDALIAEIKEKFPDLLKEIAKTETDITGGMFLDEALQALFETKPPLVRTLMQNYGTNVMRAMDEDHWVDQWSHKVLNTESKIVLTDDVRFFNEKGMIRDTARHKGVDSILIRLERTDLEATDQHQSETEQKEIECDYTITTKQGELDKLEEELLKIINEQK